MKHIKIYVALVFLTVLLSGCTTDIQVDTFPEDNVSTENCAGCKQFNEELRK